ncbi:hypothetical protein MPSEU_000579100 [Mayamaea pseudoterrestris]|nr:hypothetical protein MPSEU_000579100 [Mayamaea pseudoterrestris]
MMLRSLLILLSCCFAFVRGFQTDSRLGRHRTSSCMRVIYCRPCAEDYGISTSRHQSRRAIFRQSFLAAITTAALTPAAIAFEGGVGGLGKTRPETGLIFLSDPISSNGIVSGELLLPDASALLVNFETPKSWPLLTGNGLDARDLQTGDSAFVQIVKKAKQPTSSDQLKLVLLDSVLSIKGKFGAYGSPTDIKVKSTDTLDIFAVSFTTLTPGQRESERKLYVKAQAVGSSLLLFAVGSTRQRFISQEATFRRIIDSFLAVPAPASNLSSRLWIGQ